VRAADDSDFAEFVAGSSRRLLGLAYLLTGDQPTAQESLQAALGRTYRHWHRLNREGAPEDYARGVLVNDVIGRHRWRQVIRSLGRAHTTRPPPTTVLDPGPERTPLLRAVGGLPTAQRAVLVLRHFAELSDEQVAAVMDCSVGAVKGRYARALASLTSLSPSRGM
jgi:RNA polymerase sigma-70 factor (sigma-E family)